MSREDERLDVPITGPRFVLLQAGIDLNALRPDLVTLLRCGGSGGGLYDLHLGVRASGAAGFTLRFTNGAGESLRLRADRRRYREILLHLPCEPEDPAKMLVDHEPDEHFLRVGDPPAALRAALQAALGRVPGAVGVNNHMGSRFTAFRPGMETVLRQFRARGLMFLDSRTTAQSGGEQTAQELGVPSIVRHVFLDDDESLESVRRKLSEAEAVARRQGFVVAIGHPHEATLQALAEWLPTVPGKGLALAPASAVLRKRNGWD